MIAPSSSFWWVWSGMSLFSRLWNFIRRPTGYIGKDLEGNYFYEYASTSGDPRRTRRVVKYKGKEDTLAVANRSRQLAVQWKSWLTHTRLHPPSLEELQADLARRERLRYNVALIEARDREERLRITAGQSSSSSTLKGENRHHHSGQGQRQETDTLERIPRSAASAPQEVETVRAINASASTNGAFPLRTNQRPGPGDANVDVGPIMQVGTKEVQRGRQQQQKQLRRDLKQYNHNPWVPRAASDEPQAWTPRAAQRGG